MVRLYKILKCRLGQGFAASAGLIQRVSLPESVPHRRCAPDIADLVCSWDPTGFDDRWVDGTDGLTRSDRLT